MKETKAQRAERLKREKNPWEAFDEVRAFARAGRSSVVPEWASLYFKWWGIYTQGDGVGATGGKGGEGVTSDYFMMRIGIPNGILSVRTSCASSREITKKYARNLADITVRQAIQLHWLTIESLPEMVDALDRHRPLAQRRLRRRGAQRDWLPAGRHRRRTRSIDASPLAARLRKCSRPTRSSTTCRANSRSPSPAARPGAANPEINDVGLTAVDHNGQVGYSLRVGGGLSREPHIAVKLDAFILPDQAVAVVDAVAEIFRDQQGLRESRERARLKYLFLKEGWTAESFLAELQIAARLHAVARRAGAGARRHLIATTPAFIPSARRV